MAEAKTDAVKMLLPSLHQAQVLFDILHAGQRDPNQLGNLGTCFATLDERLYFISGIARDHGALAALLAARLWAGSATFAPSRRSNRIEEGWKTIEAIFRGQRGEFAVELGGNAFLEFSNPGPGGGEGFEFVGDHKELNGILIQL